MRILFYLFLVFVCLSNHPALAGVVKKDISYGDLKRQALDIYAPSDTKTAPVMLFVHGGGWTIGDKKNVGHKHKAFNDKGYVFVSVGYPLLPDHGVDIQAQSIADSIAWVIDNIQRYGGDPKQIHLMGHSAGAHLVALVASDGRYLKNAGRDVDVIRSVISVDGASMNIPKRMSDLSDLPRWSQKMFQSAFGKRPRQWEKYSPYHYFGTEAYTPAFLFLTASERAASNLAAHGAVQRLQEFGVNTRAEGIAGRNHITINRKMGKSGDAAFAAILRFIE